ncbi:ABC transporter permease [Tessaracoccus caeni]|uniref:ABC transporter permease n=1 Tax=Tessaracoccus caeni TaxID=3031239 RepID=UPI0023D97BA1|nr:ABC-2 family transporter protein [Tessaracoccus caeni]MDF1489063.1 ABC-2 family transporter protein [Tessaracoccus caeni]
MGERRAVPGQAAADLRPVTWWFMVRTMIGARIRAQTGYRSSFAADLASQLFLAATEFVEIYVLLHNAPVFGGMNLAQATVVYGLACVAFGIADMLFGQLDNMHTFIREGRLETLLVRPTSLLLQLVTADVQLRRLGRAGFGLAAYLIALAVCGVEWTPVAVVLAVLAPLGGVLIFGALFLASGSLHFWVLDGQQAGNAFVYGGRYVSSVPASALMTPLRVFFTFVVPATLVAYVPAAVLVGAPLPAFLWPEMAWLGIPVGVLLWAVVLLIWRAGVRRYSGAGG